MIRRELTKGSFLRKIVRCREEEEFLATQAHEREAKEAGEGSTEPRKNDTRAAKNDFRIDFTNAHFYIPEDLKYRAELRFEQKGSGWLFVLLTVVFMPIIASLICQFLPDILQMCDNLITFLAP